MRKNYLLHLDKRKLRRRLMFFFLCLVLPTAALIQQSYSRLKWETFHQHQQMAEELTKRINVQLIRLMGAEERRPFTDYAFLNVAGAPSANFLQRSPLSQFPPSPGIPGLIGYFQVDSGGKLLTPVVPENAGKAESYGITVPELNARMALQERIQLILSENRLVRRQLAAGGKSVQDSPDGLREQRDKISVSQEKDMVAPAEITSAAKLDQETESLTGAGQSEFDELKKMPLARSKHDGNLGRIEDLKLNKSFQPESAPSKANESKEEAKTKALKKARTEYNVLPEVIEPAKPASAYPQKQSQRTAGSVQAQSKSLRIRTFESAVDAFEFSQLDSGQFLLFRKVWLNDQRYIQGLLIDKNVFFQGVINAAFQETTLAQMSDLLIVWQGNVLSALSGQTSRGYLVNASELNGELLYQAQLSDPFNDLQLVFSITRLPVGAGGWVIIWLAAVLTVVFLAGFYWLYRLGARQIELVNQQQDFVSAVSHELKTPLTSIRMYGEMLQAGWVDEARKRSYYDFILDESERLTRLINNVLQLAKLTRNSQQPELKSLTVGELMDAIRSKTISQIERAGFTLNLSCPQEISAIAIRVNPDWFIQITINLVDNALKFAAKSDIKRVEINCRSLSNGRIQFSVRDYGPGIAKGQMKKIFQLFYRAENELTRETVGTGIGLALTSQMVNGMRGRIDVINASPGVEFKFDFPVN